VITSGPGPGAGRAVVDAPGRVGGLPLGLIRAAHRAPPGTITQRSMTTSSPSTAARYARISSPAVKGSRNLARWSPGGLAWHGVPGAAWLSGHWRARAVWAAVIVRGMVSFLVWCLLDRCRI
jgi:hypothetical protein